MTNPEGTASALTFVELLDQRFDEGRPRRHAPGTGAGEEEVLLQPSPEVMALILGPPPEMVRAIRPKMDNYRPVRQRTPKEIVGHRLEMRQRIGSGAQALTVGTVYYIHRHGEVVATEPPRLRKEQSGSEPHQYVRQPMHEGPLTEYFYEDLGSIHPEFMIDRLLPPDETSNLYRFIGGCRFREPGEFE